MLLPKPLFIELKSNSLYMREAGSLEVFRSIEFHYRTRPSGKIIKTNASKNTLKYERLSLEKSDEKKDLYLLSQLIKRTCKTKLALVKRVLIWNVNMEVNESLLDQIERLSLLCDARETIIVNESIGIDKLCLTKLGSYKMLGKTKQITGPHKSIAVLVVIIVGFFALMYFRLTLPS